MQEKFQVIMSREDSKWQCLLKIYQGCKRKKKNKQTTSINNQLMQKTPTQQFSMTEQSHVLLFLNAFHVNVPILQLKTHSTVGLFLMCHL